MGYWEALSGTKQSGAQEVDSIVTETGCLGGSDPGQRALVTPETCCGYCHGFDANL